MCAAKLCVLLSCCAVFCLQAYSRPSRENAEEHLDSLTENDVNTSTLKQALINEAKKTLLVGLVENSNVDVAGILSGILSLTAVESVSQLSKRGVYKLRLSPGAVPMEVENHVRKNKYVLFCESDQVVNAADVLPNDPKFEAGELWGLNKINAASAWDMTIGSSDVIVCVIDTGVDYTHEDLAGNMWINPGETGVDLNGNDKQTNGIDDDNNGYIDDVHGINAITGAGDPMDVYGLENAHGTHCAGIVGGVGNNGVGVVGVNQNVSIMSCKFLGAGGFGTISDAVTCMDYAIGMNATLTTNSWGGAEYSSALAYMLDLAQAQGQLFVTAAGNSAADIDITGYYPASYPHNIVVSVAATTSVDGLSMFSNYGQMSVDLGAPGNGIWSTIPNNGYVMSDGTSMAAPHVAGVLALMYALQPSLSASNAKQLVMSTGEVVSGLQGVTVSGKRLDAVAALEAVNEYPDHPAIDYPSELFGSDDFDLSNKLVTFSTGENTNQAGYNACSVSNITDYIVDPSGGDTLSLSDDDYVEVQLPFSFPFAGLHYSTCFVGSNGYITFETGDSSFWTSLSNYFSKKRVSPLMTDLQPDSMSTISWKSVEDKFSVTWDNIKQFGLSNNRQSFQIVLHESGTIQMYFKGNVLSTNDKIVGISSGEHPDPFLESDFSATTCSNPFPENSITCATNVQINWSQNFTEMQCIGSQGEELSLVCPAVQTVAHSQGFSEILVTCI